MYCRWNWWSPALPTVCAWESGLVYSTLCAGKRFLCPACSASELWGAEREREKRAVGKYFNSWPLLVQDLALRGQRQAVYLLFSDTFWRQWEPLSMLPPSLHVVLHQGHHTYPTCWFVTLLLVGLVVRRAPLWGWGQAPRWGAQWGSSVVENSLMTACSMSRDAPVLPSCQEDSCPESWHQIQVISEQVLEFREIKWSLPALPCPPWQHFLEPSVTEEQKLDPAVVWWFHPLQPNRRFGLDAPTAQWK